jgi:hypothetical protein
MEPWGAGWTCSTAARERGRLFPAEHAPRGVCDTCRVLDERMVTLSDDGSCAACASDSDLHGSLRGSDDAARGYVEGVEQGLSLWRGDRVLPAFESAVAGWVTIGSRDLAG